MIDGDSVGVRCGLCSADCHCADGHTLQLAGLWAALVCVRAAYGVKTCIVQYITLD